MAAPLDSGGDQAPEPEGSRRDFYLKLASRLAWASPTLPVSAFLGMPLASLLQPLLGVAAAMLLVFHLVNILFTRRRLGHWEVPRLAGLLRSELVVGCVGPLVIALLAFGASPAWPVLLAIGVLFLATHLAYEALELRIYEEIERAGLSHGTRRFRKRRLLRPLKIDEDLDEMAEREHGPGPLSALIALGKPPWRNGISRTRTVILCIMLGAAILAAGAAAQDAMRDMMRGDGDKEAKDDGPPRPRTAAEEDSPDGHASGNTPHQGSPGDCRLLPAYGAPRWARAHLNALYLGGEKLNATKPPGFKIGGCPGRAVVPTELHGSFVYTSGRDMSGELKSIAMDSHRFGPAIFLAPATAHIRTLLDRGVMPLGGYPRVPVDGGDMVPVLTPNGTIVLVRSAKHLPGRIRFAAPYVELPPAVAAAWVGAMRERQAWLWPLTPQASGERLLFPLSSDSHGAPELTVSFDRHSGAAARGPLHYPAPQAQLGQMELKHFAAKAAPDNFGE